MERIIPILTFDGSGLVKTLQYNHKTYIGCPINAVRIFSQLLVDELILIDISQESQNEGPNFLILEEILNEASVPISYGGGVRDIKQAEQLIRLGIEKLVTVTAASENPSFVRDLVSNLGSSSVVVGIDLKSRPIGDHKIMIRAGKQEVKIEPQRYIENLVELKVGEILLNSIDKDGTLSGYDYALLDYLPSNIEIPIILNGGCSSMGDIEKTLMKHRVAAAASSFFLFRKNRDAIMINYPEYSTLVKTGLAKDWSNDD